MVVGWDLMSSDIFFSMSLRGGRSSRRSRSIPQGSNLLVEPGDCFVGAGTPLLAMTCYFLFSLYHSTVRRMPSSNGTCALQPKYSFARVTSRPRRGRAVGL